MSSPLFDVHPFAAIDGFKCNLLRLKNNNNITRGPVLLVHGAGVRANTFNPPNEKTLIQCLAEAGYDVWLENWRGSIECEPNQWDLDIVSENDHPAAVREVCRLTGTTSIKAIIHCQGSTSFTLSAIKGLVPQVSTIVSNAVSLHPIIPSFARFKLNVFLPLIALISKELNPQWGNKAPDLKSKFFRTLAQLTHWEKDTIVGKLVSFTYGAGFPALWELDNLTEETKQWIRNEFGFVPISFFNHIKKGVKEGALVSADSKVNYSKEKPQTNARFAFFAGKLNKCFCYQSQVNSFNFFNSMKSDFHTLHLYDTYSHLDIFYGKNSHKDIFPEMIKEINN